MFQNRVLNAVHIFQLSCWGQTVSGYVYCLKLWQFTTVLRQVNNGIEKRNQRLVLALVAEDFAKGNVVGNGNEFHGIKLRAEGKSLPERAVVETLFGKQALCFSNLLFSGKENKSNPRNLNSCRALAVSCNCKFVTLPRRRYLRQNKLL